MNAMRTLNGARSTRLERIGTGLSLACAIHCMAMPLLLAAVPLAATLSSWGARAETFLLGGSSLLAAANLCWGYRVHRRRRVFTPLAAALALIAAGLAAGRGAEEVTLVLSGSALLVFAQWLNRRFCHHCQSCCDAPAEAPSA
jgi:hypothetical protein